MIVILDAAGNQIGEGPGIWLDIVNIKTMYDRAIASDTFNQPWTYPTASSVRSYGMGVSSDPQGYPFQPAADETSEALVFVHGWKMLPQDIYSFGETMFKRLWGS